jgi:hypothetical protein
MPTPDPSLLPQWQYFGAVAQVGFDLVMVGFGVLIFAAFALLVAAGLRR